MTALSWDQTGDRVYELGVDHGVLYIPDPETGDYDTGVAWNGLTTVTESPSGAEAQDTYADNIKYATLRSAETFGATIEAYTAPDEWAQFDGLAVPVPGLTVGGQTRKVFGLSYRTLVGDDINGQDGAYKLHMVWGLTASPSEKAYASVNDSPEPINFSWEVSSIPVPVTGMKPTSIITVKSSDFTTAQMAALEALLYGDGTGDASLPFPDDIIELMTPVGP